MFKREFSNITVLKTKFPLLKTIYNVGFAEKG